MRKLLSFFLTIVMVLIAVPFYAPSISVSADTSLINKKFDLGGRGTATGYIGVSATEAYTRSKGYGFSNTSYVTNVNSSGSGASNDAVNFRDYPNNYFNVDLPAGIYKITVTTGNVNTATIIAEGQRQLNGLTGNNATDSFMIPVTDGQLNIYPTYGGGNEFSISSIEIEQTSTGTTMMPTIWVCGDDTCASYYNCQDTDPHGWGQYLGDYIDSSRYYVRNISSGDVTSKRILDTVFETAEYYGKSGDILLIAAGAYDYRSNPNDSSEFVTSVTAMVRRAKAKGMTVYLVKQNGTIEDCTKYPLVYTKWFGNEMDAIAASENVGVIDLYRLWLEFCLEHTTRISESYYAYGMNANKLGAQEMAKIMSEQLFPRAVNMGNNRDQVIAENIDMSSVGTAYYYETVVSGGPIANPHKGFIMSADSPRMFTSDFPFGIGGSYNNQAWNLTTVCSGYYKWKDLNPAEGVFNWEPIDEMLEVCAEHGMTYGIRILPYSSYDGDHTDNYGAEHDYVPSWVYAKGAAKERVALDSNPSVYIDVPKWDDDTYLKACRDLASALAERYDGDPRVEFIDIRPFGDWGEWHFAASSESSMPSIRTQNEMVQFYRDCFDETLLCITSDAYGEVYDNAISLGITKRDDGLIATPNIEWGLRLAHKANLPVLGENYLPYHYMLDPDRYGTGPVNDYDENNLVRWTPQRFREVIEIAHLSMFQLDQDSNCGYYIYNEQKDVVEEMCNRLGYNLTVTSAKRYDNKLVVTIKNTGLAPAYFDINLCAEVTDSEGNKLSDFGQPVLIPKGSFRENMENTYVFEYGDTLPADANICLAMYDVNNYLVAGLDPTVKFDNKNNLANNRLLLVESNREVINDVTPSSPSNPSSNPSSNPAQPSTPGQSGQSSQPSRPTQSSQSSGSTPETGVAGFVERLYTVALGRRSDPNGKAAWINAIRGGESGAEAAKGFLFSDEFLNTNMSNSDFVTILYRTFFDRQPDVAGLNGWVAALGRGDSKQDVIMGFINSTEWANVCLKYGIASGGTGVPNITVEPNDAVVAFATRLYTTCLKRSPDQNGLMAWARQLANLRDTGSNAAHGFFFSDEMLYNPVSNEEFVTRLYLTFMDRQPDSAGKSAWVGQLEAGVSREEVFHGFAQSAEFGAICANYGIIR